MFEPGWTACWTLIAAVQGIQGPAMQAACPLPCRPGSAALVMHCALQPASLLPLVDMSNHSFEPNAKVVPGPGGSMQMVALR